MKYLINISVSFILILGIHTIQAQDSTLSVLSNKFVFEDGLYMEFESFQNNAPDLLWDDVKVNYFVNPKNGIAQVGPVLHKATGNALDMAKVWGISIEGVPYLLISSSNRPQLTEAFIPIRLRGKICYLQFEQEVEKDVTFSAYNPLTGRPFRTAKEKRKVTEKVERIMHFDSGEIRKLNIPNFLEWIKDDSRLYKTVKDLTVEEARDKLYKCLLIYNDRNLIQIK